MGFKITAIGNKKTITVRVAVVWYASYTDKAMLIQFVDDLLTNDPTIDDIVSAEAYYHPVFPGNLIVQPDIVEYDGEYLAFAVFKIGSLVTVVTAEGKNYVVANNNAQYTHRYHCRMELNHSTWFSEGLRKAITRVIKESDVLADHIHLIAFYDISKFEEVYHQMEANYRIYSDTKHLLRNDGVFFPTIYEEPTGLSYRPEIEVRPAIANVHLPSYLWSRNGVNYMDLGWEGNVSNSIGAFPTQEPSIAAMVGYVSDLPVIKILPLNLSNDIDYVYNGPAPYTDNFILDPSISLPVPHKGKNYFTGWQGRPRVLWFPWVSGNDYNLSYSYIDHFEKYWEVDQYIEHNKFVRTDGTITMTPKAGATAPYMVNDFDLSHVSESFEYLTEYDIEWSLESMGGDFATTIYRVDGTDTLGTRLLVHTDGKNKLEKLVLVEYRIYWEWKDIGAGFDWHQINYSIKTENKFYWNDEPAPMWTDLFEFDNRTDTIHQRTYYMHQMDIANGLFVAEVNVIKVDSSAPLDNTYHIEGLAIDRYNSFTIWEYHDDAAPTIGTLLSGLRNIPPWSDDTNPDLDPSNYPPTSGDPVVITTQDYLTPFILYTIASWNPTNSNDVKSGSYYPSTAACEDARSVILMSVVREYWYQGSLVSTSQTDEYAWMKPAYDGGWVAFFKCTLSGGSTTDPYFLFYGDSVIKRQSGTVVPASEFSGTYGDPIIKGGIA